MNYYILFENSTQGLKLKQLLKEDGVESRIAPTPRSIQGELSCGVSLLLTEEYIDAAKASIEKHQAPVHSIVPLPCQINPRRDRYC